jgi:hypothetical protein
VKERSAVGNAVESGYAAIKGGVSRNPAYHYILSVGPAYTGQGEGWQRTVVVDKALAQAVPETTTLGWIKGRTVAVFTLGDETYAQYIEGPVNVKPKKQPKEESIVQQVKKIKEAEKAGVPVEVSKKTGKVIEKTVPPPKPEKAKRPKTMSLL